MTLRMRWLPESGVGRLDLELMFIDRITTIAALKVIESTASSVLYKIFFTLLVNL